MNTFCSKQKYRTEGHCGHNNDKKFWTATIKTGELNAKKIGPSPNHS